MERGVCRKGANKRMAGRSLAPGTPRARPWEGGDLKKEDRKVRPEGGSFLSEVCSLHLTRSHEPLSVSSVPLLQVPEGSGHVWTHSTYLLSKRSGGEGVSG